DDVVLVIDRAPHVASRNARLACHIHKLHSRFCIRRLRFSLHSEERRGLQIRSGFPPPQRRNKRIQHCSTEPDQRCSKKSPPGKNHLLGTFGKIRGTIPVPSFTAIILSTGMSFSRSTCPLGHLISSVSILLRLPNPK